MRLDAATVLLQWAAGGMVFVWVTTRHRKLSLGYGWMMRGTYATMLIGALVIAFRYEQQTARDALIALTLLLVLIGLVSSIVRKGAGVSGQSDDQDRRSDRVAEMTGIDRQVESVERSGPEFNPVWDLAAGVVGLIGLLVTDVGPETSFLLGASRLVVGALFLGSVTDAMLLGHWYLVQPGLARGQLLELVRWVGWIWPFEVIVMLIPIGMVSALNGSIDDGYGGILGWFWVVSAITTIGLIFVTRAALKERYYSAVMAATGLLYLAILTAFGTDLVARAILST
jgi:hypothetical protein